MASLRLLDIVLSLCSVPAFLESSKGEDTYLFPFHTRESWNATPPSMTRPLAIPVQYVVIHHTFIPGACNTTDQCNRYMKSMQTTHNSMEWGDIGYNFCVGGDGGAYEGRGWHTVGIHAGNANPVSISICLIGDWREDVPPQQQLKTTKELIKAGADRGVIRRDYKLIGHNQAMNTECPGVALNTEIAHWDHYLPGKIDFSKKV